MEPLILIVDDSPKNLKLARDVLQAAGLRTLEAETGAAIALAAEHLPDVILMDSGSRTWTARRGQGARCGDAGQRISPSWHAARFHLVGDDDRSPSGEPAQDRSKPIKLRVSEACAASSPPLSGRTRAGTRSNRDVGRVDACAPLLITISKRSQPKEVREDVESYSSRRDPARRRTSYAQHKCLVRSFLE